MSDEGSTWKNEFMQLFQNEGQAPEASWLQALVMLGMGVGGWVEAECRRKEGGKLRKQELSHGQSVTL